MRNRQVINRAVAGTSLLQSVAVFAGGILLSSFAIGGTVPIADWTFEITQPTTAGPFVAESGPNAASSSALGYHASSAAVYSSPTGNGGGKAFSSNTWAIGDYYQFSVNSPGYSGINFEFDEYSSGTGPGQFQLYYSTNGTTFTAFGSPYTVLSAAWSTYSFDLSSITALNGATDYFRLVDNSLTDAAGTANVGTAGTDRVDNVIIAGTPVVIGSHNLLFTGGLWNTSQSNTDWYDTTADAATYFTNGDVANFSDSAVGTVQVDAGGVSPSDLNISNNTGTYTFTGGSINDNGTIPTTLTKTNNGTLILNATNGYSGGTVINGGTLEVASNDALGNVTGGLTLNGAALQLTGGLNLVRPIVIGSSGATITTGGNNLTIGNNDNTGGTFTGTGNLTVTGGGTLTTYIAPNLGNGILTVQGGTLDLAVAKYAGVTFQAPASGAFTAQIIFDAALTLNINGGYLNGAGASITVNADGSWIYGSGTAATTTIGDPIIVNGPYTLGLGADAGDTLNVTGGISGFYTLEFLDSSGIVTLSGNDASTDSSDSSTIQSVYASNSTYAAGVVRLGSDNALPIQPLLFGGLSSAGVAYAVGALDLNGHNQTLPSLGTVTDGTSYSASNGITNSSTTLSTLTIDDQGQDNQTVFAGLIGVSPALNLPNTTNNIALTLAATNTGSLTLIAPSTYTGPTTINGGTLILASGNVGYDTSTTPSTPIASTGSIANSQVILGSTPDGASPPTLSINATGTSIGGLSSTNSDAMVQLNGNVLTIANGNSATYGSYAGQISAGGGGLAITGGTLQFTGATKTLGSLSITGGKLDLTNSDLIVTDTAGSTAAIVNDLHLGTLFTSDSVSDGKLTGTTLGYIDTGTQLDIKYTWYGDLDLDGKVTTADYNAMVAGNGTSWAQGDLNYDGTKNADDFSLFQLGNAMQNGSILPGVPEPTALAFVALPMLMGMRRRRR